MIVGETPNGEVLTPYVMKYTCNDASLDNYIANGLDFYYFEGSMSMHKYTDFFVLGEFDRTETQCPPELNEVGDPIPCDETSVSGSGSLGGFGLGSGTGNPGSGTGTTGGTGTVGGSGGGLCTDVFWQCEFRGSLHDSPDYCNEPWHGGTYISVNGQCDDPNPTSPNQVEGEVIGRTVNDDCPECETNDGGVPINTTSNLIDKDALAIVNNCFAPNGLDNEQTLTVVNNSLETVLADYITVNGCSAETQQFLEEAIEAIEEGSEVDFEDNIINSLTNECAKYIFWGIEGSSIEPSILDSPNVEPLTFTDIILDLFNDNTGLTYTIQNSNIPNSQTTTAPSIVTTSLSNTYLENATQLSIARTMIHELVHAYLLALYYNPVTTNSLEFFNLMQDYAEDNGLNIDDDNFFHHEFMGQYVDAMAYSLYLWDRDYGTGGNLGWNYYWSMAFGGLYTQDPISGAINYTDSFIELVPNEEDREDIINIIINEQNGTSDAEGSTCE